MKEEQFELLKTKIKGEILQDELSKITYATDASVYREKPLAVIIPEEKNDIVEIINFAKEHKIPVIPRGAGTSLAGQVVGKGIIVDFSKNFKRIIEVNENEKWVRIEPGVVLDELNNYLEKFGLFFGPETSTSNRCVLGGMLGNNSCGAHSIIYGSTRDHTISIEAVLSDGSIVLFEPITKQEFKKKCEGDSLENRIYKNVYDILSNEENKSRIIENFPDAELKRRNNGYALDLLIHNEVFNTKSSEKFNFCKLLAGSEGTLAFVTEIKLNLVELPPKDKVLVCAHFNTLKEAFNANLIALKFEPGAVEFIDNNILECTANNREQQKNRFFVKGSPKAILIIEFARNNEAEIDKITEKLIGELKEANFGYHFPVIKGTDINKVWTLRKAGLGLLSNIKGDKKSVTVIEDTAVNVKVLPDYLDEFEKILIKYNLSCVYHAHIGSGELHLRPQLNLKDANDLKIFRSIAYDIASLVKKYKGSLSGEHGDGRLRGEFIPFMIGDENYNLLKQVKHTWDPNNIFNPGKIIDTPQMNTHLRYITNTKMPKIKTVFDFSQFGGLLEAAEQCNGSADCRKSSEIGGTMCPSYQATRNENNTTRARANTLREILTYSESKNVFNNPELYKVMDLCLSCKACKSECPSSVDVAKLKAEFLQHYYQANGIPLRTRMIANITRINKLAVKLPSFYNFFLAGSAFTPLFMNLFGFSAKRKMPALNSKTFSKALKKYRENLLPEKVISTVYLFNDEFTNYNNSDIGLKTVQLLNKLGYKVIIPKHIESGRTYLSKGLIKKARKIALKNINYLKDIIGEESPLIGIEPSTILTFRDEYPDLTYGTDKENANRIASNTFMVDEFIAKEIDKGNIVKEQFTNKKADIKLHGHCQQKAIASTIPTLKILSFPENYQATEIPSGCCGMAGSFGFEKEHYELSMKIGELVLFPEVRKSENSIIAAPGTSCRHQIFDGTSRKALHPVEILYDALV
ncbi:MAG: FAD-binding protein [Chlorobi bacterium]|nr:FAD-binding protein [Chlorobiota bacterium]